MPAAKKTKTTTKKKTAAPKSKPKTAPKMPTIGDFMTAHPHTIGREQTLEKAHELMRAHNVRHLPVLHAARLVGIVSERDLHLVETLRDVDPATVLVEEAMSPEPTVMKPSSPLVDAVVEMARHKLGSIIVAEGAHVVGVFTTIDAMRALLVQLGHRAPK